MDEVMENKSKLDESEQMQLNLKFEIKNAIKLKNRQIKNNIICFSTAKTIRKEETSVSPISRILKSAEKLTW